MRWKSAVVLGKMWKGAFSPSVGGSGGLPKENFN